MKNLYGLILAGGSGTRLWPISRDYYPKQFLKILDDTTLIQRTFIRLKKLIPSEYIYITTNRIFVDEIINQLKDLGFYEKNIIIQPADKNTGPAIAHASKKIFDIDQSAIIAACPSDHLINSQKDFNGCMNAAYALAKKNLLVTFGIKPQEANPQFGYIIPKKSKTLSVNSHISYQVKEFVEKPTAQTAKNLIKKDALWNSGIFIWKAEVILKEINKFSPNIYQATLSNKKYFSLDSISIDNCLLEKSNLTWIIPATFDWKDIGSWNALYELLPKDTDKNVLNNRVTAFNCNNSLIYGTDNRFVAAMNLNNLIVVDTKDYVLITSRDDAHGIKNLFQKIVKNKPEQNLQRPLVTIIIPTLNNDGFIEDTVTSVLQQSYKNIEYIVIDGGSTDKTLDAIGKYGYKIEQFLSMPHAKFFEEVNKGIEMANGEIIGILKPGNIYNDNKVIEDVVEKMEQEKTGVLWGDMVYSGSRDKNKVSMFWKSSSYKKGLLQKGWIPPYATFFARKNVYQQYGSLKTKFSVAAEYELLLRLLEKYKVPSSYISRILVRMTGEGISLKSVVDRFKGNLQSYRSWKENGLKISPLILFSKNISKVSQLFKKADNDVV